MFGRSTCCVSYGHKADLTTYPVFNHDLSANMHNHNDLTRTTPLDSLDHLFTIMIKSQFLPVPRLDQKNAHEYQTNLGLGGDPGHGCEMGSVVM
jgi:hypothetical protein